LIGIHQEELQTISTFGWKITFKMVDATEYCYLNKCIVSRVTLYLSLFWWCHWL